MSVKNSDGWDEKWDEGPLTEEDFAPIPDKIWAIIRKVEKQEADPGWFVLEQILGERVWELPAAMPFLNVTMGNVVRFGRVWFDEDAPAYDLQSLTREEALRLLRDCLPEKSELDQLKEFERILATL
jgi:hypothetical protein